MAGTDSSIETEMLTANHSVTKKDPWSSNRLAEIDREIGLSSQTVDFSEIVSSRTLCGCLRLTIKGHQRKYYVKTLLFLFALQMIR